MRDPQQATFRKNRRLNLRLSSKDLEAIQKRALACANAHTSTSFAAMRVMPPASIEDLEALSGKQRRARLDAIRAACQTFINGPFLKTFDEVLTGVMRSARIAPTRYRAESDPADTDQQTVLFWYPVVTAGASPYIRSAVKIEAGAKSALDPHSLNNVRPYAADDVSAIDLQVTGITTVDQQRTFWDKVVILHVLRAWYDRRRQLRHGGQRVSRHFSTCSACSSRSSASGPWRISFRVRTAPAMPGCSSTAPTSISTTR